MGARDRGGSPAAGLLGGVLCDGRPMPELTDHRPRRPDFLLGVTVRTQQNPAPLPPAAEAVSTTSPPVVAKRLERDRGVPRAGGDRLCARHLALGCRCDAHRSSGRFTEPHCSASPSQGLPRPVPSREALISCPVGPRDTRHHGVRPVRCTVVGAPDRTEASSASGEGRSRMARIEAPCETERSCPAPASCPASLIRDGFLRSNRAVRACGSCPAAGVRGSVAGQAVVRACAAVRAARRCR